LNIWLSLAVVEVAQDMVAAEALVVLELELVCQ
jgi:hypothetical protein